METAKLYFTANGQRLTKTGEKNFASNTVNYIEAIFDLGDNCRICCSSGRLAY